MVIRASIVVVLLLFVRLVSGADIFDVIRSGDVQALTVLLEESQEDISNTFDEKGNVPLMVATKLNRVDMVLELLEWGANVNAVENRGRSALFFAVEGNLQDVSQALLNYGANPKSPALDGQSPLSIARERDYHPILEYLQVALGTESPASEENKDGNLPQNHYSRDAEKQGDKAPDGTQASSYGSNTAPDGTEASSYGNNAAADGASYSSYSQDATDDAGNPSVPEREQSKSIREDEASYSGEYGATSSPTPSMTESETEEETQSEAAIQQVKLMESARDGKVAELQSLFAEGDVNLELENDHGWTPLIFAASHTQVAVANVLIAHGANVAHKEKDGWTALMFASYIGNHELIKLLLQANASVLDVSSKGIHVLDAALLNPDYDINVVTDLASAGLREALDLRSSESVMDMVAKGADLTTKANNDWTALLFFASTGDLAGVTAVLDRCKVTPAHDGKRKPRSRQGGFNPEREGVRSHAGKKPDEAKPVIQSAACEIATVINDVEASEGWTPLMFAASLNNEEMVRRLLLAGSDTRISSKTERPRTKGTVDLSFGKTFGRRIEKEGPGIGATAISIALEHGFTYLADMIRRGDVLAQERAGTEIGRLIKFRALKETQAMEFARQTEMSKRTHDERDALDPLRLLEVAYDYVRFILM